MSKEKVKKSPKQELKKWLTVIVIGAVLVIGIRNFGFRITTVKGVSMEPNYIHGELVFTDMFTYKVSAPKRNDIVICEYDSGMDNELFIKRVIAGPGDEINIYYNEDESCYNVAVNGETINEDYIMEPMLSGGDWQYPIKLVTDEYFVMGDNRNISADSRDSYIGIFDRDKIIGKVRFKIMSKA